MPLAIDELIRKATDTTNLASLIPQVWAPQVEPNLRKRAVLQQSVITDTSLVDEPGDRVFLPILPDLPAAVAQTEGADMVDAQLNAANSVPLIPAEVGSSVGITRKALDRLKYDGMSLIVDRLTYAMSLYIEGNIAALFNATVPGVGGSMADIYPLVSGTRRTSATITATDYFTAAQLRDAVATLQSGDMMPFDDGLFMAFLHPKQINDLFKDSTFRDDLHFAEPQAMLRGEVGIFAGCHIISSTHIKTATEDTSVTVYKGLVVGPRWAAVAFKRQPELVVDPTIYDFGRRRRVGIVADLDIRLIHSDHGIAVTSAASL